MELYRFDRTVGKKITAFDSDFVMSRIVQTEQPAHIGCMYLKENEIVGYHQATMPQIMLIVAGEGMIRATNTEYIQIEAGDAVFWSTGEWHETKTETGLTAIIIESEHLTTALFMSIKSP